MKKILPKIIQDKAVSIENYGIKGDAFIKDDLISLLINNDFAGIVILGGDILRLDNETHSYQYTYDNWHISEQLINETFDEYCKRSHKLTLEYIKNYPKNENVLFLITHSSDLVAGL